MTDWFEEPEIAKVPDVGHDSQQYPVDYVIRQCQLMLEVIYPIHTPSDAARRLCLYEDSMVKQLRRHRLLYALKDYL